MSESGEPSARPKRSDDPGPVRQGISVAQRAAIKQRRASEAGRERKLSAAAEAAASDMRGKELGIVRSTLFDAQDWRKEHASRQDRMESTFSRLYKPTASSYWTAPQPRPPRQQAKGQLPTYAHSLPAALSLAHPASREDASESSSEEEDAEAAAAAVSAPPFGDFDPMAEPLRFFRDFKQKVSDLKTGVKQGDNPLQGYMAPRNADAVVAAANASPPKSAKPAEAEGLRPSASTLSAPILDEDFEIEPSLVYTDSAHFLAEHGVQIPMWDELDNELRELDGAHELAMDEIVTRKVEMPPEDVPPPAPPSPGSDEGT